MRQCEVYVHGVKAGVLKEDENGYSFIYDKPYLQGKNNPPVSLTLPLRGEAYHSEHLFPFFFNMCPKEKTGRYNPGYYTSRPKMILASCLLQHAMTP